MFNENIDFNNLKNATLVRVVLFISKGVSGDIFRYIPKFGKGRVGARGGEFLLLGRFFSFF